MGTCEGKNSKAADRNRLREIWPLVRMENIEGWKWATLEFSKNPRKIIVYGDKRTIY